VAGRGRSSCTAHFDTNAVLPFGHYPPPGYHLPEIVPERNIFTAFRGHIACTSPGKRRESGMLRQFALLVFALAAGFTASGIVSCLYRLVAEKPKNTPAQVLHWTVMIFAGPNVLIENASKSYKAKDCSAYAFWFAAIIAGYWSLALGLFVIQLGMAI
jgi:hypothetical protein